MDYENESESTNMFTTICFSFNKNIILILEFWDPFYPEASKDSRAIWAGGGGAVGWKPGQRWRPVHGNLAAVRPPHPCPTPVQIRSSVLEGWSSFSRSRRTGPLARLVHPPVPPRRPGHHREFVWCAQVQNTWHGTDSLSHSRHTSASATI